MLGICDDIFIIACLSKALSCAAEMKKILKADLDMDLNAPNSMFSFRILPLVSAQLDLLSKVQYVRIMPLQILPQWGLGFQRMACVLQEFRLV